MMKRQSFQDKRVFTFLALILTLVHVLVLFIHSAPSWGNKVVDSEPEKIKPIDLKLIELRTDKRQIVASEDPSQFETPQEAKFLSDKNRKFDRETRAQNGTKFQNSSLARPQNRLRKDIRLSDLGLKSGNPYQRQTQNRVSARDTNHTLSATSDFLDDVPLGDVTHLNTREFKYYGFYLRIRQKLEQFWGRSIRETAEELVKKGRRVSANENLITSLAVTLDENGEITAIKVIGPSGMREMDDAAIESFNQAGPFPNPPKDLIVDGQVVIEWGFVVQS